MPWPLAADGPFWPWYMLACAAPMALGYKRGGMAVPALILCGLISMRGVMWGLDPAMRELAAYTVWLCVAVALMYKGAWVSGALCLLSGVTYPTLLVLGVRIEYLGLAPIIADAFLIAAIFSGWHGMAQRSNPGANRAGLVVNCASHAAGMAARQAGAFAASGRVAKIKAGR